MEVLGGLPVGSDGFGFWRRVVRGVGMPDARTVVVVDVLPPPPPPEMVPFICRIACGRRSICGLRLLVLARASSGSSSSYCVSSWDSSIGSTLPRRVVLLRVVGGK